MRRSARKELLHTKQPKSPIEATVAPLYESPGTNNRTAVNNNTSQQMTPYEDSQPTTLQGRTPAETEAAHDLLSLSQSLPPLPGPGVVTTILHPRYHRASPPRTSSTVELQCIRKKHEDKIEKKHERYQKKQLEAVNFDGSPHRRDGCMSKYGDVDVKVGSYGDKNSRYVGNEKINENRDSPYHMPTTPSAVRSVIRRNSDQDKYNEVCVKDNDKRHGFRRYRRSNDGTLRDNGDDKRVVEIRRNSDAVCGRNDGQDEKYDQEFSKRGFRKYSRTNNDELIPKSQGNSEMHQSDHIYTKFVKISEVNSAEENQENVVHVETRERLDRESPSYLREASHKQQFMQSEPLKILYTDVVQGASSIVPRVVHIPKNLSGQQEVIYHLEGSGTNNITYIDSNQKYQLNSEPIRIIYDVKSTENPSFVYHINNADEVNISNTSPATYVQEKYSTEVLYQQPPTDIRNASSDSLVQVVHIESLDVTTHPAIERSDSSTVIKNTRDHQNAIWTKFDRKNMKRKRETSPIVQIVYKNVDDKLINLDAKKSDIYKNPLNRPIKIVYQEHNPSEVQRHHNSTNGAIGNLTEESKVLHHYRRTPSTSSTESLPQPQVTENNQDQKYSSDLIMLQRSSSKSPVPAPRIVFISSNDQAMVQEDNQSRIQQENKSDQVFSPSDRATKLVQLKRSGSGSPVPRVVYVPVSEPQVDTPPTSEHSSDNECSSSGGTSKEAYTYDALMVSDGRSKNKKPKAVLKRDEATREARRSGRYSCSECGKQYATSSNLSRHKQTHRSLDSQSAKRCSQCGKAYVSMPALAMHQLTHRLEHSCRLCGKLFSRPWLLQGHLRSHTGEKPYGCAHCGKAFADRSNLRAHMQTHSADKQHECAKCGKQFALKSYLNKHLESACTRDQPPQGDGKARRQEEGPNDVFDRQQNCVSASAKLREEDCGRSMSSDDCGGRYHQEESSIEDEDDEIIEVT